MSKRTDAANKLLVERNSVSMSTEYDVHSKRIMISNHGKKELVSMNELLQKTREKSEMLAKRLVTSAVNASKKCITVNVFTSTRLNVADHLGLLDIFYNKLDGLFEYPVKQHSCTLENMGCFKINTGLHGPKKLLAMGEKVDSVLQTIQVVHPVLYQIAVPTQHRPTMYMQNVLTKERLEEKLIR